ncbi:hypothetical protein BDZ88DRAFT_455568 [Geranomyces variabilis]|nr:hypothetical protein BDZ88DRAFT_455568 [Geranomyces variabilis]KAJ3134338.1 hypothetical protein HDU90_005206 [Geranomyces variabilis]
MPAVPYTVAQQIVAFLLPDFMITVDVRQFLFLALTCQSFKTAAYQHRQALMFTQAAALRNGPLFSGFPFPRETKNPFVDLDYILADCVVHAPEHAPALLKKYRNHFERDMRSGLMVVIVENGAVCSSRIGRNLRRVPSARPPCVLIKDAVNLRGKDDPEYDPDSPADPCEFAIYYRDFVHGRREALWTPAFGSQTVKKFQYAVAG